MTQQQAARTETSGRLYVLVIDDEHEAPKITKVIAEKHKGSASVRVVTELRLARLMDDDKVMIGVMKNVPGQEPPERGKAPLREIVFTEPVSCGDHWSSQYEDGLVMRSSFMAELAQKAIKAGQGVVKEKDGVLRVHYA